MKLDVPTAAGRRWLRGVLLVACILALAGCDDSDSSGAPPGPPPDPGFVIDVTQPPYGAKGDGFSDDYAAFAAALQALADETDGGTLYIPAGYYRVVFTQAGEPEGARWALEIPANVTVKGDGPDWTFITVEIRNPVNAAFKAVSRDSVVVRDLRIVGDKKQIPTTDPANWTLLKFSQCTNVEVLNLAIEKAQRIGLEISSCSNLTGTNLVFHSNGWVEEKPGNDPQSWSGGMLVTYDGTFNENLAFRNVTSHGNGTFGLFLRGVNGLDIDGGAIYGNGLYEGHGNQDGVGFDRINNATIRNLQVYSNLSDGIPLNATAADASASSTNVVISGNTVHGNHGNGILVYSGSGSTGELSYITISHNTVYNNNSAGTVFPYGFDGIRLSPWGPSGKIHHVYIHHNTVYDNQAAATQMDGIGQLPQERDADGGLAYPIHIYDNTVYDNAHSDQWIWETGVVVPHAP